MSENTFSMVARIPDPIPEVDELGHPQELAPNATVRIPEGGVPLRFGQDGPIIGHIDGVRVEDGAIVLEGTVTAEDWLEPQP